MPIDNDVYNREGEGWWEEDNPLNILHGSFTPGRFAYFREILTDQLCTDLPDLRALDIGCGGGWRTADGREAVHDQRRCGDLCKIKAPRPSSFCASRRVPVCRRNGKLDPLGISVIDVPGFDLGEVGIMS